MQRIIKILSLEDNDFDFGLISRKLQKSDIPVVLERVTNEMELRESLKEFNPDIILSDFSIPSFSGLAALKIIRSEYSDVPFIFVSGTIGEERAVEALKLGANDYVLKDNLTRLIPSLKRVVEETEEKEKRKEAEKKLLIKNHELKSLIYRISHDVRGPICTIKGAINLMFSAHKLNEHMMYIDSISLMSSKIEKILQNLNKLQYIYEEDLRSAKIDFKEIYETSIKEISFAEKFESLNIKFETEIQDHCFYSERNLIFTVVQNLLHNAIIFSDKGEKNKNIKFTLTQTEGDAEIKVEDNGIGVPIGIQEKIFDMFYRGSEMSKGAGLGLYITKIAVERLKGEIKIESQEGIGTSIKVKIPSKTKELELI